MAAFIIYVRGGCVQDVISDEANHEYMLVDYDNEDAGDSPEDRSFERVRTAPVLFERTIAGGEKLAI